MNENELSPSAQAVLNATHPAWVTDYDVHAVAAAVLRAAADQLFPYEEEARKAEFDCEPQPRYNFKTHKCDGPLAYDHGAYLRRSWAQEELNKKWKARQESRAQILAIAAELDPTTTETTDEH